MSGIDIPARSARAQISSALTCRASGCSSRRRSPQGGQPVGTDGNGRRRHHDARVLPFPHRHIPEGQVIGQFEATGIRPKCSEKMAACGYNLPMETFEQVQDVGEAMLIIGLTFASVLVIILGAFWLLVVRPETAAHAVLQKRMKPEDAARRSRLMFSQNDRGTPIPGLKKMQQAIDQSGVNATVLSLLFLCCLSEFMVAFIIWVFTRSLVVAGILGAIALMIPYWIVRFLAGQPAHVEIRRTVSRSDRPDRTCVASGSRVSHGLVDGRGGIGQPGGHRIQAALRSPELRHAARRCAARLCPARATARRAFFRDRRADTTGGGR